MVTAEQEIIDGFLVQLRGMVHCLGEFWRFRDGYWREVPLEALHTELMTVLQASKWSNEVTWRRLIKFFPDVVRIQLAVPPEHWNRQPALLPCRNGVLDMATRKLVPHEGELALLRTIGVDYVPRAKAPAWSAFLHSTVPQAVEYLQEFAGLCLTFETRYETALWLYGPPGSGKSTFLCGLEVMLGERAGVLNLAALDRGRLSVSGLLGRSLLLSVEQPVAELTHDHLLNALISGEPVPIARGRQLPASVRLPVKWVWAFTALPRLKHAGSGLFRRVRIVRFPARAEPDRDPSLKARLALEGSGILNWALAGWKRLQARGRFAAPPGVMLASERFQHDNDLMAQFIADQAQTRAAGRVQSRELYSAYHDWCSRNGQHALSSVGAAADWERLGFERKRIVGRSFWFGLELNRPLSEEAPGRGETSGQARLP